MSSDNPTRRESPNNGFVSQVKLKFERQGHLSQSTESSFRDTASPPPPPPRRTSHASTPRANIPSKGIAPMPPPKKTHLRSPKINSNPNSDYGGGVDDSHSDSDSAIVGNSPNTTVPSLSGLRPPSRITPRSQPIQTPQSPLTSTPPLPPRPSPTTVSSLHSGCSHSERIEAQPQQDDTFCQSPTHTGDSSKNKYSATGESEHGNGGVNTGSDHREPSPRNSRPPLAQKRWLTGKIPKIPRTSAVHRVFKKTQDDLEDNNANLRGQEGLCTKCKNLSSQTRYLQTRGIVSEWATPLSRVLYHGTWCNMCRFIVKSLCAPECDPLLHPAVASHIQDNLKEHTMQTWAEKGWEFIDKNWPFGHGSERHEGETYVLGRAYEGLESICRKGFEAVTDYGFEKLTGRDMTWQRSVNRMLQKELHRDQRTKQYQLSCVLKISRPNPKNPSFLLANLWGYGRGKGAPLQILSSFQLRLASSQPPSLLPSRSATYGKLVDPDWIDPSVGRSWIEECEKSHGSKCSAPGWASAVDRPDFLRVVDVKDYCIKPIRDPKTCRYIALSYVWGVRNTVKLTRTNQGALEKKNSLLKCLSSDQKTILDAIKAVRSMDVDYLWVDTLCIAQDDRDDSQKHIDKMDQIYSSALATIVAADGHDVSHGLVGIKPTGNEIAGKTRQIFQESAKISDDLFLCAPLSTREYAIDQSKWNSRAWTYQERLLSRRLIFFINGEIIWYCRGMACREDLKAEDSQIPMPHLDWINLKKQNFDKDIDTSRREGNIEIDRYGNARLVRPVAFEQFVKAVEEYAYRERTLQHDVLKAFTGMTQIFSACLQTHFIFGLPEAFLDVALLWKPEEALERRKGFPSWSWCGWIGRVTYPKTFCSQEDKYHENLSYVEKEAGEEGIQPLIKWHTYKKGRLVPVNETGRGFVSSRQDGALNWQKGPSYLHDNGTIRPVSTFPAMPRPPTDIRLRTQCLYMWTGATANIRFGKLIDQPKEQKRKIYYEDKSYYYYPRKLELLSRDSRVRVVGNILLDGLDDEWLKRKRYEFLQIAEAKFLDLDNESKDVSGFPLYLVMLVEWNEEWTVATRLGIGRLQKEAWNASQPRLAFVQLA